MTPTGKRSPGLASAAESAQDAGPLGGLIITLLALVLLLII